MTRREAGFVLLNALLLMAALSAAAVALLRLTEDSRTRIALARTADQAQLMLDAAEPLALQMLLRPRDEVFDHLGQDWARDDLSFAIGDGRVDVRIVDLQSRFNVNWLSRPEDYSSYATLVRLLGDADRSRDVAIRTAGFLAPPPLVETDRYADAPVPIRPPGGVFALIDEWRQVEGVTDEVFRAMRPVVAALPDSSVINVNTVSPEVFAAMFAPDREAAVRSVLSPRAREPFTRVKDFLGRAAFHLGERDAADIDPARLSVRSGWFEVTLSASLGELTAQRRLIVTRPQNGRTARAVYRLADPG